MNTIYTDIYQGTCITPANYIFTLTSIFQHTYTHLHMRNENLLEREREGGRKTVTSNAPFGHAVHLPHLSPPCCGMR